MAPRLSFNEPIAGGRRVETVRVPMASLPAIRREFDCTINDVVLAGVAGALRRVLERRGELHPGLVVKAFCPVSVRADAQRMELGNRISAMFVPLPVGEADARARIRAVRATTADLKDRNQSDGTAAILNLSEYVAPAMLSLAARIAHAQPFANLVVTNIPGPDDALYCLGARMVELYPIVPLSRNLTLNVAILSYHGQLHFGLVGDGDAGRDLEVLAGGVEDAFDELTNLPEVVARARV
jgi:WS/DGAT/MGAT family acyltransferase